ncbi:hypothetical protein B566_EDAN005998 [Ephemera danica]|nr:hypothetical protein B566_EDAN005998 [Ephemera danica]
MMELKSIIRTIILCAIIFIVFMGFPQLCSGHELDEPPAFRYSREANENPPKPDASHSHGGHGHAHGGHGHAHGAHGHAHGGHGHAHVIDDDHDIHHGHAHAGIKTGQSSQVKTGKENIQKEQATASPPEDITTIWFEAILSTLLISAAPFFILFLVPLDNSKEREPLLKILLSFASGGLLGDAFLHLIPHALVAQNADFEMDPKKHAHSHSHSHTHLGDPEGVTHGHDMSVGLWVLFGIVTFLLVEKFVRLVKGDEGHHHGHSHHKHTEITPKKDDTGEAKRKEKSSDAEEEEEEKDENKEKEKSPKKEENVLKPKDDIKVAGYLNLAADFTHNFTDGLAIGASYLAGRSVGMVTTATILLHEVPHEIGDFAILIQSGCSRKKIQHRAKGRVGALTGTVVSLLAEGIGGAASQWILPFTAGGFIYIATVSVIPELLVDTRLGQSIKEIIALLIGVYMMVLIADYE